MLKVISDRLTCDVQPHCVSLINKIAGAILAFPLGTMVSVLYYFDVSVDVMAFFGGWIFVLYFINSVMAVALFWAVLIRPFVSRNRS